MAKDAPDANRSRAGPPSTTPGPSVLWADDSEADQFLIRSALGPQASRVEFVGDGTQLLHALRTRTPAKIILDIHMPNMDGIEALRRLRGMAATQSIPVIIFSTVTNPGVQAACRALGILDFVEKPVPYEDFASVVRVIAAR